MKFYLSLILILFFNLAYADTVKLDGKHLTFKQLTSVVYQHSKISLDAKAIERVEQSHELLLLAAEKEIPIYGLNRGVGLNKDKTIFQGNALKPEAKLASQKFNLNDIYATSAGVGENAKPEIVRAAMLIRLNTLLLGHAGAQVAVVQMLADFLNNDITPILPAGGSIGEADITILAHLGLAINGKGDVLYKGKIIPAAIALKQAGLKPVDLYAKDALAIFSSNAYTAGIASLAIDQAEQLINKYELLTALSLQGINGNISPFLPAVQTIRPYPQQITAANNILFYLKDSYLLQPSDKRALQDPLSFRTASQVIGAARLALDDLKRELLVQINSSDDNPAVVLNAEINGQTSEQEKSYYVDNGKLKGAVIPNANFEPINWVLSAEKLNIALAHLSASATQRIVKLSSFCINQLARFLSPDQATIAFAAIQKPIMYLNTKIQQQSIPISTISYPVAGEIEDTATNSLLVIEHLQLIINDLYQIMGFELLHASQAIDLKKQTQSGFKLSKITEQFYLSFREQVKFLEKDRELTPDIKKADRFIKTFKPITSQ